MRIILIFLISLLTTQLLVAQTVNDVNRFVSTELNGLLVDPDGAILSSAQFDSIRRQIQSIERSMKKYGVEPGSDEARRLF